MDGGVRPADGSICAINRPPDLSPSSHTHAHQTKNSFVYISSAGVDRVTRPGLDLEQEPPAVRMNDMLGAWTI